MQKSESNYNLIDWWKKVVFENYANFSGRARRTEYWYYVLAQLILIIPAYIVGLLNITTGNDGIQWLGLSLAGFVGIATLIPSLAVTVRRLHDTNKSGWYYFLVLVPFGGIILLIFMCQEGNPFRNQYGDDPKRPEGPLFDFEQSQPLQY